MARAPMALRPQEMSKGKPSMKAQPRSPLSQHCLTAPFGTTPPWLPGREALGMDSEESHTSPAGAGTDTPADITRGQTEVMHPTIGLATSTVVDETPMAIMEPLGFFSSSGVTVQKVLVHCIGV